MGATLLGFLVHGVIGFEPATIALTGAVVLMIVAREDPHEVLREVEWPTLFFFIGLFMLVAGVIEIGLIEAVADAIVAITGGALGATAILVLWVSTILSGIIDNIPYTATMIPVVEQLTEGQESDVLWWALAIGADLGGNMTIIGASANVILASMAEREGHPITFGAFLRYGLPVTIGTVLISTVYLWVRYLL
jgi:Na+/H+ antiporter NhaD/arsenite permease-like protein